MVVHRIFPRCIRRRRVFTCVPPLLSPPTEPTTTIIIAIISTSTSTTIADAEMTAFYLTPFHADALCLVETRNTWGRLWPAGRGTFTRETTSSQDDIDVRCDSRELQVPFKRLEFHRVDCSTRRTSIYLGVAPDSSLTHSTQRDSATRTE